MMLYSQNGYSAKIDSLMATYTVPTTNVRVTLRKGDTSVILLYLMEQYHKTVEPLKQSDTGGYNPRSIVGSRILSNHASGTAVDVRWQKHVRGRRGTFTAKQEKAVRKILAFLEGVVRWGEDYQQAPIDGMHFEIVGTLAAVKRVADKIRAWRAGEAVGEIVKEVGQAAAKPVDAAARKLPVMRIGRRGRAVRLAQAALVAHGHWPARDARKVIDGIFGPGTEGKVKAFQKAKGLPATGIVDTPTWDKLMPDEPPTVKKGSHGYYVTLMQALLIACGFNPGPVDGDAGDGTIDALRRFQARRGVKNSVVDGRGDGIGGDHTWVALLAE